MKTLSSEIYLLVLLLFLSFAFSCKDDDPEPDPGGNSNTEEFYDEPFDKVPAINEIRMYEANPRVFASTNSLNAITARLDEIKSLGTNVLWLMPVTEQGKEKAFGSPYCVKDYKKVESTYGNLEDLRTLVKEAHKREMAVILDWVANHTSWDNEWVNKNPDWYTKDASGNIIPPEGTNWSDVADLDYNSRDMREAMIDAMKYWIREANIDGYRCDAADWIPSDFWRDALYELRKMQDIRTIIMLAEGTEPKNLQAGFDLDYGWNFCDVLEGLYSGTKTVANLYQSHSSEFNQIPNGKQKLRFTTNHDRASENSPIKTYGGQTGALSAFVISSTLGGVPLIYSSQEVGYASTVNFFNYVNINWNNNPTTYAEYQKIMDIRSDNEIFQNGQLQTFEDKDIVHYFRYDGDEKIYVIVNVRNEAKTMTIPVECRGSWTNLMENSSVTLSSQLRLNAYEYYILSNPILQEYSREYGEGITRISNDSLSFVLFAPEKTSVYLIGDFNNWETSETYRMQQDGDYFFIKIGNLDASREYICQYLIDDKIRVADPYANKISDPWNDSSISSEIYPNLISYPTGKTSEIAMVVSTKENNYSWKVEDFTVSDPHNLIIYEILIRDFTEKSSIKAVQEKIPYLKELGINAVELMPFNEFEANNSWGYNPSFYFATDKAYGTSNDYKDFIDACHQNGMAVIMDMVLNHSYGQSPMVRMYMNSAGTAVTSDNPWYNVSSPNTTYYWGYDFNHESKYTQAFVDSVCAYWMKEYKIDGFRFDFTKGFTNTKGDGHAYDASRISILKRMADQIWKRKGDALVILEHLTENSEEKVLAEYGMMLWGNLNYNMNEATMGWVQNSDLSWASYKQRNWLIPNLIVYMESHDEERLMYKNEQWGNASPSYNVQDLSTGLKRCEAAAVILFSIPGPKMMWQFGELGYDYKLGSSMEDGRLDPKPVRWDYYDQENRKALHDVFSEMIHLKKENPTFSTTNYSIDLTSAFKYIVLKGNNETVVAMANFDVAQVSKNVNFERSGNWKEYFSKEALTTTSNTQSITLEPGEYRLYFSE